MITDEALETTMMQEAEQTCREVTLWVIFDMATKERRTVGARLFWAYANLGMAEMAVYHGDKSYGPKHFMVRAKLYAGLTKGTMQRASLVEDQRIKMRLPERCLYCGAEGRMTLDHLLPRVAKGPECGDNAVWACQSCNSSKGGRDLMAWWLTTREGFPPLFALRLWVKLALAHCEAEGIMELDWNMLNTGEVPFSPAHVPGEFPPPAELIFTHSHEERKASSPGRI